MGFSSSFPSELSLLASFRLKSEHMLTLSLSFSPENVQAVGRSRHWVRTSTNQIRSLGAFWPSISFFRNQQFSRDPWEKLWSLSIMKNAPSPVFSRKSCLSQWVFFMKIAPNKTSYFKMPDSFLKKQGYHCCCEFQNLLTLNNKTRDITHFSSMP